MQLLWRPRVYFEEWDEPMISGIAWVSELIEAAGGIDIFPDRAFGHRLVVRQEVPAAKVVARLGFEQIPAVQNNELHEIKSPIILQPGPVALTDGLMALQAIMMRPGQTITAT